MEAKYHLIIHIPELMSDDNICESLCTRSSCCQLELEFELATCHLPVAVCNFNRTGAKKWAGLKLFISVPLPGRRRCHSMWTRCRLLEVALVSCSKCAPPVPGSHSPSVCVCLTSAASAPSSSKPSGPLAFGVPLALAADRLL